MQLNDLFENSQVPNSRYSAEDDRTVLRAKNSRKVRLTLEQINKLRRMHEVRKLEQSKQDEFFKTIYGAPPPQPGI